TQPSSLVTSTIQPDMNRSISGDFDVDCSWPMWHSGPTEFVPNCTVVAPVRDTNTLLFQASAYHFRVSVGHGMVFMSPSVTSGWEVTSHSGLSDVEGLTYAHPNYLVA